MAGAGIQIVMQESNDVNWFQKKVKDAQAAQPGTKGEAYNKMKKWQVAPKTFAETNLDANELNELNGKPRRGQGSKPSFTQGGSSVAVGEAATDQKSSVPKFAASPSAGNMSERKWKSPHMLSNMDSDFKRGTRQGVSPSEDGQSPFGKRSMTGSQANRSSWGQMLQIKKDHNQLPLERVAAMKLMTNKLKKVAKMPVQMENKFCSHVDLETSAQLINADDLARMDS